MYSQRLIRWSEKEIEMSEFHVIVPSRYSSNRLPGKPLLKIAGKPMIQHVIERCEESNARSVVVATDDVRILDCVKSFGGSVVMTSSNHQSGSDRIAEACTSIELDDDAIVVNVQGDEPDMPASLINQLADALANTRQAGMVTASAPLANPADVTDPSVVKVVCDRSGYALYFSRATIPWVRDEQTSRLADNAMEHVRRHLGIYAYRCEFLKRYSSLPRSPLEDMERLEQLRVLWHGEKILCVEAAEIPGPGIDTREDLDRARAEFE